MSQSEFEIIRRYFAESGLAFERAGVELGIGDDAALLRVPQDKLLTMSVDVLVAGVHFPAQADPALVANRALAVNLSDLAAMAAQPFCFTLGLVLPMADEQWLQRFSQGLLQLAQQFNCPLVGGDTTRGPLTISIQVQGLCTPEQVVTRDGARPGDKLYVSGNLGDGAIALASLGLPTHLGESFNIDPAEQADSCRQYFEAAFYKPVPRLELAQRCAGLVNAGIDISDGLLGDLGHITAASGVGALLHTPLFPYSASALCCMTAENRLRAALFGGDDYELCLSVAPDNCDAFEKGAAETATSVRCVGEIIAGSGITCLDEHGSALSLDANSFDHFLSEG